MTVKVNVLKVNEAQALNRGKVKQEVVVADSTGKATVTLLEPDVGLLKPHKSYQLNRLEIHSYQGKHYLAFPSAASIEAPTSSDDDNDQEQLQCVTVSGIRQLETVYMCINCNKIIHSIMETGTKKYTLRA